jgi:hypothetical protein
LLASRDRADERGVEYLDVDAAKPLEESDVNPEVSW